MLISVICPFHCNEKQARKVKIRPLELERLLTGSSIMVLTRTFRGQRLKKLFYGRVNQEPNAN